MWKKANIKKFTTCSDSFSSSKSLPFIHGRERVVVASAAVTAWLVKYVASVMWL